MKIIKSSKTVAGIVVLLISLFVNSCQTNYPANNDNPAPDMPPVSTFLMDFSHFPENKLEGDSSNFIYASANVLIWNIVVAANMIIPASAFTESFRHEGIFQPENGSWIWSYNFNPGVQHKAELHCMLNGNNVSWEMYISKTGSYTDFLWFSGEHDLLMTEGTWILSRNPENMPGEFLNIEWTIDKTDNSSSIKYTIIEESDPLYGGYINFGLNNNSLFDAFYNIYNSSVDISLNIQWNTTNKNGRVQNSHYFGDDLWHCWDTNLANIDCN